MKNILLLTILFLSGWVSATESKLPGDKIRHEKTAVMLKAVDLYHQTDPDTTPAPTLKVIYLYPNDMTPKARYKERISAYLDDFNLFFREEFIRNGLPPREMSIERNPDQSIRFYEIKGSQPASEYSYKNGQLVRADIQASIGNEVDTAANTLFIICAFSRNEPDSTIRIFSPFYGEYPNAQLKTHGKAYLMDHESVELSRIADTAVIKVHEHGPRRMDIGGFNQTYIGGAIHELGHGLGMTHNVKMDDEASLGEPLMGAGNYTYRRDRSGANERTYLSLTEITQLVSHPLFTRSAKGYDLAPTSEISDFKSESDSKTLTISGKITTAHLVPYALLIYADPDLPKADYDAMNWVVIPHADGTFSHTIPMDKLHQGWWLRLSPIFPNGKHTRHYYRFENSTRK